MNNTAREYDKNKFKGITKIKINDNDLGKKKVNKLLINSTLCLMRNNLLKANYLTKK